MIIIPMAGTSSRFFEAGYTRPKYMLEARGETLFDHSVKSFSNYFESEGFLFIVRNIFDTLKFITRRIKKLGITNFDIAVLDRETRGQAETVALGMEQISYQGQITIFNIDTFRPGFKYPDLNKVGDGYLEVFKGEGDNWSFVSPKNFHSTEVASTTEKNPISDLCCTGLYHFKDLRDYLKAYNYYRSLPKNYWEKGELYVAPLYNFLITRGKSIHFHLIDKNEVIFCGTPEEYLRFKEPLKERIIGF